MLWNICAFLFDDGICFSVTKRQSAPQKRGFEWLTVFFVLNTFPSACKLLPWALKVVNCWFYLSRLFPASKGLNITMRELGWKACLMQGVLETETMGFLRPQNAQDILPTPSPKSSAPLKRIWQQALSLQVGHPSSPRAKLACSQAWRYQQSWQPTGHYQKWHYTRILSLAWSLPMTTWSLLSPWQSALWPSCWDQTAALERSMLNGDNQDSKESNCKSGPDSLWMNSITGVMRK